ncbi:Zinc finger CCHC domain-containing protein 3 [Holothuria leucospilota]|uniref:Zinc finger CCHC domain-containing protein 3 n=1 Tax=Holothuria leucospilota TaxID=206669 RepID=A0A9Q1CPZ1_HOLLE|nr:Zinc finger CCHC domain-containing protein 3 [Holothuria leucospilota]
MLQPLAARNTYDLKFRSDAARIQGVSCLKGLEGLTVTPFDRSVVVTVLYLNFEPRTCFKCGEEGHEAKSCPNRRCGKCLQVGHDKAECPNKVRCNLCGEEGHVSGSCPTYFVL